MGMHETKPANVLFSKTQRRLLGLLFGVPERSHYMNEIVRHADSGIGAVQRALDRLVEAGLVIVTRQGNQKHFQANPASPIFDELRSIVRKAFDISENIRFKLSPILRDIEEAFLYGPAASGEAAGEVDLLVVSDRLGHPDIEPLLRAVTVETGRRVRLLLVKPEAYKQARSGADPVLKRALKAPRLPLVGQH